MFYTFCCGFDFWYEVDCLVSCFVLYCFCLFYDFFALLFRFAGFLICAEFVDC